MQNHIVGFDNEEAHSRIDILGRKTPTEIFDRLSDADLTYLTDERPISRNLAWSLAKICFADFLGVKRKLTQAEIQAAWDIVQINLEMELLRRQGKIALVKGPWPPESFFSDSGLALFQLPLNGP